MAGMISPRVAIVIYTRIFNGMYKEAAVEMKAYSLGPLKKKFVRACGWTRSSDWSEWPALSGDLRTKSCSEHWWKSLRRAEMRHGVLSELDLGCSYIVRGMHI